jgi:hypothetical protein
MQARRILACLVSAMLFTAPSVGPAHAQLGVTCYKVKDPAAKATYTAGRVDGITTQTGCTINVPAVMACIPGGPSGLTPTPPGSPGPSPTSPVACYKVKCSKQQLQVLPFADEFGTRVLTPTGPKLVCVGGAIPPTCCSNAPISPASGTACVSTDFPQTCVRVGGTPGALGTFCDPATGGCLPFSQIVPGNCCDGTQLPIAGGATCFVGSAFSSSACTSDTGTFHTNSSGCGSSLNTCQPAF